ncbi:MAG: tripartite tricarboxylate transporter substrate binding protein [Hylemonella sp.]|nr:tripartite tricarboxylate transporter substrate binding protein [Hylemonella sp.]MDP1937022.1 tripartite tricarboxylate transporter substrate binding protein [Hylemonella sp.]
MKLNLNPMRRTLLAAALVATAGVLPAAHAQSWPSKPVKVIVNFPPGGAADQLARIVSQPLSEALGQPVVVENRGGAGGNIGGDAVAKSPADGYTLLMSSGGMVSINPHLYPKMPFDPAKDLRPVASVARIAVYLVTRPELPAKNVSEFLAHLKANPGKISFGSPGTGSSPHLAAELMKSMTGTYAVHVPYRGGGPALQDLLGGQFDFWFDPGVGLPHVRSGKLKLLAVGSPKRSPLFPDVPTMNEAGLKGFDADSFFGLYAPAGVPNEVINRVNTEMNKILANQAIRDRIVALGGEAAPMTPAEFGTRAAADSKRFGDLIKSRGIKPD